MDLSKFVYEGKLKGIFIGYDIKKSDVSLSNITNQDEDIPAIYELENKDLFVSVQVLESIVIGISIDFSYFPKKNHFFKNDNDEKFKLGYNSKQEDFLDFLEINKILYTIIDDDLFNENQTKIIQVESSKVKFLFFEKKLTKLLKLYLFDSSLYLSIKNSNKI